MNITKPFALAALLIWGSSLLCSCNDKPGKEDEPIDYATMIIGTWDVVLDQSYESYTEAGTTDIEYMDNWAEAVTLSFDTNNTLTYLAMIGVEDTWQDTYSIHGDTLFWDVKPYVISHMDNSRMVMEYSKTRTFLNAGGNEVTTNVTKHYEMTRKQ